MLQSIVFDNDKFTFNEMVKWLLKHKYKALPDFKKNTTRFRQENPEGRRYSSKKITDGITFVFQFD